MHEQELQDALDAVGVAQISCNPITDNNAAKALQRVAAEEAMPLSKEQALSIARSAAGDLRSAIEAVQLLCTGVAPLPPQPKTRKVAAPALSAPGVNSPKFSGPSLKSAGCQQLPCSGLNVSSPPDLTLPGLRVCMQGELQVDCVPASCPPDVANDKVV